MFKHEHCLPAAPASGFNLRPPFSSSIDSGHWEILSYSSLINSRRSNSLLSQAEGLVAGDCGQEVDVAVDESAHSVTGKLAVARPDGLAVAPEFRYPLVRRASNQRVVGNRRIEGNRVVADAGFARALEVEMLPQVGLPPVVWLTGERGSAGGRSQLRM